jgi:phage-related protein (TIGR01555 family)
MNGAAETTLRLDGWFNHLTGMGMGSETETRFSREPILQADTLSALYYGGDDLAATVVDALPEEALRRPPKVTNPHRTPEEVKRVQERLEALGWVERFKQAAIFARLYGDGGVWIASEGEQPQPRAAGERVRFLKHVDRRVMLVGRYYTDPKAENLGTPETFSIVPVGVSYSHENMGSQVHETRIARLVGWRLDPIQRAYNAGWNYSVLQRCINTVEAMGATWEGISALLRELSIKVLKVKGLQASRASRPDLVMARLATIKQGLSTWNLLAVDADSESFDRVDAGSLTGAAALLEMVLLRVASAARMPVSILFGRSPAGLNATGESETRAWYASVSSYQSTELQAPMSEAARAVGEEMFPGSEGWGVEFPSLWEPTEAETVDAATKVATLDQILITNGVFTPEQIATLRGGSGGHWRPDYTSLDVTVARALSRGSQELPENPDDGGETDPPPPVPKPSPGAPGEGSGAAP